jgi:hypothetical protein
MRIAMLLLSVAAVSGCGESAAVSDLAVPADLAAPADLSSAGPVVVVTIRGQLKNDLATSKQIHNMGGMMAKPTAQALGDLGHYVFLGLPPADADAGTTSDALLIIDEWTSAANAMQFYSDPNLQQAFAALFAAPPDLTFNGAPAGWTSFGKINPAGQGTPLYLFAIRGALAASVAEPGYYNQLVAQASPSAMAAGNVALVPLLRANDATQAQLIGLWNNLNNALAIENDPQFQAAVGMMFAQPPEAAAYSHSDWFEW